MKGKHHIALRLITFLVYVFLIGPLLIIKASSFGKQNALVFPGQGFTFKRYAQVFQMNAFINAALLSIGIGLTALRRELTGSLRPFRKAAEKYADMIERKQNLLVTP